MKQNYFEDIKDKKNEFLLQQYSKASEMLVDDNIVSRISGLVLFEKIMNNNETYYWKIIELLTNYLKEKRNNKLYDTRNFNNNFLKNIEIDEITKEKFYTVKITAIDIDIKNIESENIVEERQFYRVPIETDIQMIINILGNRNRDFEKNANGEKLIDTINQMQNFNKDNYMLLKSSLDKFPKIDLSGLNLYKAELIDLHFENTNLHATHLVGAKIKNSHFENSILTGSHLEHSNFLNANFNLSNCNGAHFEFSIGNIGLKFANCWNVYFNNSELRSSNFENCYCQLAKFNEADLIFSNFTNTNYTYADFENANCSATNIIHDIQTDCNIGANFKNIKYEKAVKMNIV